MKVRYECGQYSYEQVMSALAKTKMSYENQVVVLNFLVNGVRLKDLGVSKQRAHARIKQVLRIIKAI